MGKIIAFLSQKGGVGKSTLARAVACEASKSGLSVRLADLDVQQSTSADWHRQRISGGHESAGSVEVFTKAADALRAADSFDLLVLDGAPRASSGTLEAARAADLAVLPCCPSRDDLVPGLKLAYELEQNGVARKKIVFALVRASTAAEIADAREYIGPVNTTCQVNNFLLLLVYENNTGALRKNSRHFSASKRKCHN